MSRFSIIIPTWNNLAYLKLCVDSIRSNSHFSNQIIVFVNEGHDGTVAWLESEGIDFLHAEKNAGICIAVNACRPLIQAPYVIYMNDDMYACPDWDLELSREIDRRPDTLFMLSSTLIEPRPTGNPHYTAIIRDFGDSPANFREQELLAACEAMRHADWSGASWPPSVVSLDVWDKVGGYSIEFSPGMYSDPDFAMKLWKLGVRTFKGVGASKVYHFGSKSTKRVRKNTGSDTFLLKWGITAGTFYRYFLRMGMPYATASPLPLPRAVKVRNKLKRLIKSLTR